MSNLERATLRYINSYDHRAVHAHGVWGGITPSGEIHANFYYDYPAAPETVTHEVTPQGQLGNELERTPPGEEGTGPIIERRTHVTVVLTRSAAKSIGEWLLGRAEELEEHTQEEAPSHGS